MPAGADPALVVILRCCTRHEELVAKWGTATPEDLLPRGHPLIDKMRRQRRNVEDTLEGCLPNEHAKQIEALLRGLDAVDLELSDDGLG